MSLSNLADAPPQSWSSQLKDYVCGALTYYSLFKLKIQSLKCFISSWMSCSSVFVLIICFTRRFQDKVLPPAVHFMMFSSFFKINKKVVIFSVVIIFKVV